MKQLFPRIKSWWFALSKREQNLTTAMVVIAMACLLYLAAWQPISQGAESARSRLVSERALLSWVKNQANQIVSLRNGSGHADVSGIPFNQMITTASKQYGLSLIRIQPRENSYQVWFEPVSFNRLIEFIDYLQQQYGIRVEAMDIEKTKLSGVVEIKRLQVSAGSLQ